MFSSVEGDYIHIFDQSQTVVINKLNKKGDYKKPMSTVIESGWKVGIF